jgi:hypothetical protein
MKMKRARYVAFSIGTGIANIDKYGRFLIQLLLRLMDLDLGNIHHRPHFSLKRKWSVGVEEYWVLDPSLQHSITPHPTTIPALIHHFLAQIHITVYSPLV